MAALRRRRDGEIHDLNRQLSANLEQARSTHAEARRNAETRLQQRKARIQKADRNSRKRGLEQIDDREGRRKHRLQTETLQSKRDRDAGLAHAEDARAGFQGALADDLQTLDGLEARARSSFRGFPGFIRLLSRARESSAPDLTPDEHALNARLRGLLGQAEADLGRFRRLLLPTLFRFLPVFIVVVFCLVPLAMVLPRLGVQSFTMPQAIWATLGCLVGGVILHQIARRQSEPPARTIAETLGSSRKLHEACLRKSEARRIQELQRVEDEFQSKTQWIEQEWNLALEQASSDRERLPERIDEKARRTAAANEASQQRRLERLEREHADGVSQLENTAAASRQEIAATSAEQEARLEAGSAEFWKQLETQWRSAIDPLYDTIAAANADASSLFPPWDSSAWANWQPPTRFANAARFGQLDVDVATLAEGLPRDPRLALPGPPRVTLPLQLRHPEEGSILFETGGSGREEILGALNNLVLRLLSTSPIGRLNFTILDPVGLGQSFSGIMHLADAAEHLINSRIWTQPAQIEQRLADLNEHMEKVIQMYLRNEYATIAEYNEQAGNIAEKYHFVVVADFPASFSDAAVRRLLRIAASGARCGVFTLIHWDHRHAPPQEFVADDLRKGSVVITHKGKEFVPAGRPTTGTRLLLDAPPPPEFAIDFIQQVGLRSRDSNRVEVPFAQIAPAEAERWSLDNTTELRVPIGRTGATKLQYLAIGKGTRQHALLAGKTGSGKSTLFHVIITNLALWCSPEQVEFYLIDFKKGVEFKCYATRRLPHARVIAIESDREFGLSVLQRLDDELRRRGDLFRALGVQDLAGYQRAGGREPMPRSLLIIDEFQEFFVEDDKIAQTASLLLDRIVRQGRAFGIHVLLGSQTLGGAYTVARSTLGQMVIRIALQCNEADAYLIMDDNNPAPRLLSRPGEGIYNDSAGTVEGNSPFQAVWLPEDVRDRFLDEVQELAQRGERPYPAPIVFEGNAPAHVGENEVLRRLLESDSIKPAASPRLWLGAPNSIKGPTEAVFHRQSGNNLLIVGQRDEATLAILSIALVSLAVQHPPGSVRFLVCDGNPPESAPREYLDRIIRAVPHQVTVVKQSELSTVMAELDARMKQRTGDETGAEAPRTFLLIHGLQKFNRLRYEEDFGFSTPDPEAAPHPAAVLNRMICEGTRLGFHVIASCDTLNNVNRFLSRQALSEFEMRVLFQMSPNDSAGLIDSPKAGALGLHRALSYNAQEGHLETFRPYALPDDRWIEQAAANLARLVKQGG